MGKDDARDMVDFSNKGRSQFIQQLEEFISQTELSEKQAETEFPEEVSAAEQIAEEVGRQGELDLSGDAGTEVSLPEEKVGPSTAPSHIAAEEMEQVMNHGMQFLAGMLKLSTGKDLGLANQSISVNKETGEVVMKFKLPV